VKSVHTLIAACLLAEGLGPAAHPGLSIELKDYLGIVHRSNGYLTTAKEFCGWMVDTRQASENPLRGLRKLNERVDVRRQRRAATSDELRKLIATTAASGERYGMSGQERSLLYRFCAETGLRANEARGLTAGDFDFERLAVIVPAGYSKHRETDTVPIRKELAEALQQHLASRLPANKAFGGTYLRLTDRTAEMLQQDLQAAGIAYIDERGQVLDFHGLRHTFVTNLSRAPSRVAQSLARHKSSAMTDRYTHVRLNDERAALDLLPDLTVEPNTEEVKATGTDDAVVTHQEPVHVCRVQGAETGARFGAFLGTNRQNSVELGAREDRVGEVTNAVSEWAHKDSDLGPRDYESAGQNPQVSHIPQVMKSSGVAGAHRGALPAQSPTSQDPDLALLAECWLDLPEHIRAAITTLVRSTLR
jgi:integrase